MTHLMEQNIHTILQIPQSPPLFPQSPSEFLKLSGETKSQLDPIEESPSNPCKRLKNIEILSPETLKSYQLNSDLLSRTQIQEMHRAVILCQKQKMRLWIAQNCHIRRLSFQTASLACYIMDLYFARGNQCSLEEFHSFGICCFRIANKMEDNIFIPINYDVFKKDRLIQIEASICLKTNFELNPITLTEISHSLHYFWSLFKAKVRESGAKGTLEGLKFEEMVKIVELEFGFSLLHEFLQMAFLILKTLKFGLDVVVANAYFLILCVQFENHQQILTGSKVATFIGKNQATHLIWNHFDKFCHEMGSKIQVGFQEECLHFLYPIYNVLITEGQTSKSLKDQEFVFDPNQEKFHLSQGSLSQTSHFKNKLNSFKRYMKREGEERLRKCSEVTHI